ncbi:hypothetical protein WJX72_007582 [[Myrmecia] bisecta]|uniref:Uncharacterized protein n=1 Tax=[Myrmecia] bisecta TaxID=41462 RepID=A0AAW1QFR4_9CHLO
MQKLYPTCCSTPARHAQTAPAQCFLAGRSRLSSTTYLKQAVDFHRVPSCQQRLNCVLASAANRGSAPLPYQENLTHVLLLTSDYGYVNWLEQGIGKTFYNVQVIGDFPEEEARKFYNTRGPKPVSEEDWKQVYEVCGGNAGLLIRAAKPNLQTALTDIITTVRPSVERGLKPSPDAGWTAQHYATAVKEIIDAPWHAVPASALEDKFGSGYAGRQVLQAMMRENLVAYRPYSTWASDIDMDAFGPKRVEVVTAPTPAHLHCMRELELPDEPPADTGADSAPSDSELVAVRKAIASVERQIRKVMKNIDGIQKDISTVKASQDLEEVRMLREELKQLREELKQLREEKRQLREEKLLLMQREASAA